MRRHPNRRGQAGAEVVEASLVFVAFLGLLFLLMDLSWAVFAKVSLQHAVREGCRYAITSQTAGTNGQVDSIKDVVRDNAMGFLADDSQFAKVTIRFYRMYDLQPQLGAGSNSGGNLVFVSVENYSLRPLVPLLRSSQPVTFTVRAGDKIEASPGGIPPQL